MQAARVPADAQRWLDMLPERVVVCSADGRVAWVNTLAERLLARPRTEIEQRRLEELVAGLSPADVPLLPRLHALPRGEGIECDLIHGTGTHIRVELASSGVLDELTVVVVRPISQRASADAHTRTYELVFDGAPVGIFHFDAQGAVTACNDAFVKILGSPRRMLLGVRIDTLPDPVMKRCMLDALRGVRTHYEGEYKSATSGQVRSVRVAYAPIFGGDGSVIGGVGIAEDVTERKRAEQAWRRSVESFRALIERAPDAIAVHRDDRFLLVNPKLVELLGHTDASELMQRAVADVLDPEADETYRAWVAESREPSDTVLRREVQLRTARGEPVTAEIASITLDYDGGPAFLSFARDVTERRALEARLAVADRLASLGTLAAGIAHEINNPLAYVLLNLDLLRKEPNLSATSRTVLERAREGSERVRVIIRDLRIFSRVEEDRQVPVDVRDAIESALNLARSELQARACLVRDMACVPLVLGDEARLTQVMLNLILNAAQACPEGDPRRHTVTVRTGVRDHWVEVAVSDTGEGIPPDKLAHIFEPFWTTKPIGVGTGLGLSIVHGIVEGLGGRIEVETTLGVGSTFRVLLPQSPEPAIAGEPRNDAARAVHRENVAHARILIIDDEQHFAEALQAALHPHHHVVLETSGVDGLARLLRHEPFDLIVCDLMMPDVSGTTIVEAVRDARPALIPHFVVMTGGACSDEARLLFEQLHIPVLEKPFEVTELEHLLAHRERPA